MVLRPSHYLSALDVAHDLHDRITEYRSAGLLGATHSEELVRRVEELMGWMVIGHREGTVVTLQGLIERVRALAQAGTLNVVQALGRITPAEMLLHQR
jgi:hypothetical protein